MSSSRNWQAFQRCFQPPLKGNYCFENLMTGKRYFQREGYFQDEEICIKKNISENLLLRSVFSLSFCTYLVPDGKEEFLLLPQLPQKMLLAFKVAKRDLKIIISLS